ncbi:MAG: YifB family Mg chelatase-like AAA ATPase, partial [Eubacteriales bacterium]|nr:YifB family Mg chelatase-like AAA ATPase [Eubacteriales bacterium]
MLSIVNSCTLIGIDGYPVGVETDISNGIPSFEVVGLGGTAVKESRERVRAAVKNSGFEFPIRRITINLAPAYMRKEGSTFDFPMTIGILSATGQVKSEMLNKSMFLGEVSLEGNLKPINGVLSMASCAKEKGFLNIFVPVENADEAAVVKGINVYSVRSIKHAADLLNCVDELNIHEADIDMMFNKRNHIGVDFADVKGQHHVKRAIEVAASGGHNCMMVGSPGCGKTMLAKRIPAILPDLSFEEAIEVTKIFSAGGLLPKNTGLVTCRPFRAPHYTISEMGLIGGGRNPKPGEISLASRGVLFLDEIQEFSPAVLEVLRQPLEEGSVTISRVNASITYPANFMLICASNPCACGYLLDDDKECSCTDSQIRRYKSKLSGPLLDRIDIQIEVKRIKYNEFESKKAEESSETVRSRVEKVRKLQRERYAEYGIYTNSQLERVLIRQFCSLDRKSGALLKNAYETLGMSARAHDRILKVARTIADMD